MKSKGMYHLGCVEYRIILDTYCESVSPCIDTVMYQSIPNSGYPNRISMHSYYAYFSILPIQNEAELVSESNNLRENTIFMAFSSRSYNFPKLFKVFPCFSNGLLKFIQDLRPSQDVYEPCKIGLWKNTSARKLLH